MSCRTDRYLDWVHVTKQNRALGHLRTAIRERDKVRIRGIILSMWHREVVKRAADYTVAQIRGAGEARAWT